MVTAVCVQCGKEYELEPGQNPADFQCECGGDLNTSNGTSDGTSRNWFRRQRGLVKASIVIGVCGIVFFSMLSLYSSFYDEVSLNLTSDQIKEYAQPIEPVTLNSTEWNSLRGKPVKFRAVAYRPYGSGQLAVNAVNGKTYQFMVVYGDVEGATAINYADVVDVYGIYVGNTSRDDSKNYKQNAPTIKQAIIIPTGQRYPMYTGTT